MLKVIFETHGNTVNAIAVDSKTEERLPQYDAIKMTKEEYAYHKRYGTQYHFISMAEIKSFNVRINRK